MIYSTTVEYTSRSSKLNNAKFTVVAVPTSVNANQNPDLADNQLFEGLPTINGMESRAEMLPILAILSKYVLSVV